MLKNRILVLGAAFFVFLAAVVAVWPGARKAVAQIFLPAGCYNVTSTGNGATYSSCVTPSPPTPSPSPTPTPRPSPTPTTSPTATPFPTATPTATPTPIPTAAPTSLAVVAVSSVVTPGPVLSMTPVVSATPTVGLLALACAANNTAATLTPPAGWNTLISASQTSATTLYVFWKWTASSEPTSVTFTANASTYGSAAIRYYRGVNPTTPFAGLAIAAPSAAAISPTTITAQPYALGTLPVSCFVANSAMGATAHTAGGTEDYSAYSSSKNGNGIVSKYNATEGQSGPVASATGTPVPYTSSLTWNATNGNGPLAVNALVFLAPVGTAAPIMEGYIAETAAYGFNAAGPNFGYYGNVPVTTTGATFTGPSPAPGIFFRVFGTVSAPAVTATHVDFSASPFPGSPTPAPSPSPTAVPTGTYLGYTNATDYPTSYVPWASSSLWNYPLSPNPTATANSAAIVAIQFPSGNNGASAVRVTEAGQYDYNHPTFYASSTDPMIHWTCTLYCGATDYAMPTTFRIPPTARSAQGGDSHIDIIQPDGTDITAWAVTHVSSNWTASSTLSAGSIANCGNWATSAGIIFNGPGPTAGQACGRSGILTAAELISGVVNHAIFQVNTCGMGTQYPTQTGSAVQTCNNGVGPNLGAIEKLDIPTATIAAVTTCTGGGSGDDSTCLWPWEKGILTALYKYGAPLMDYGGCVNGTETQPFVGLCLESESEEPWYDAFGSGYTSPYAPLAAQGWTASTIPNVIGSNSGTRWEANGGGTWNPMPVFGGTWATHMKWLLPCAAQHSC